jgi:hypothetical protein
MERAVLQSRKTILVLTPDYLNSGWAEFEALLAQALDPAARARRVIPLILKPCEIPPRIRNIIVCLDFTKPNHIDLEWRKLLAAITAVTESPTDQPPLQVEPSPSSITFSEELRTRFGRRSLRNLREDQRAVAERAEMRQRNLDMLRSQAEMHGPAERPLYLQNQINALQQEMAADREDLDAVGQAVRSMEEVGVPDELTLEEFETGVLADAALESAMVAQPFERAFAAGEIMGWLEANYPAYWSSVLRRAGIPQQAEQAIMRRLMTLTQPGRAGSSRRWFLIRSGDQFKRIRY